ncbi:MAG: hypothetical protein R2825_28020 [Saprospiraceae bacterium]
MKKRTCSTIACFARETKEIRLHGLDKEDDFLIKGEANKSILIG